MPLTMAAFVVGGLGLIGVPMTVGFISKWYLVEAALDGGAWPIAVLILASSLLAVMYVWRVVEVAFFETAPAPAADRETREAPLSILIPAWILIAASVFFGLTTELTVGVATLGAEQLLGGRS